MCGCLVSRSPVGVTWNGMRVENLRAKTATATATPERDDATRHRLSGDEGKGKRRARETESGGNYSRPYGSCVDPQEKRGKNIIRAAQRIRSRRTSTPRSWRDGGSDSCGRASVIDPWWTSVPFRTSSR